MKTPLIIFIFILSFVRMQAQFQVSGFVTDSLSGKPIKNVLVRVENTELHAETNELGFFILNGIEKKISLSRF